MGPAFLEFFEEAALLAPVRVADFEGVAGRFGEEGAGGLVDCG